MKLLNKRTGQAVQALDVTARRRRRAAQESPRAVRANLRADREAKPGGVKVFNFDMISRERWAQAFGDYDPEKFRKAFAEQEERKRQSLAQSRKDAKGTAVHGDNKGAGRRMFHNVFDWGLGQVVHSRSHRRELMKAGPAGGWKEAL
jgi:hypothetical protein